VAQAPIDPDDPPWGVGAAMLVWVSSILLMIIIPLLVVVPYMIIRFRGSSFDQIQQAVTGDPTVLLVTLIATLPTHAATVAIVWAVVTGFGKRPFWQTIGWGWGTNFGFWSSVATAILLLGAGGLVAYYLGGEETPFDQMLKSSAAARFTTAALATLTAPLVEEFVFRGVLYPALMRSLARLVSYLKTLSSPLAPPYARGAFVGVLNRVALSVLTFFGVFDARQGGAAWSVIIVSTLFLSVHVPQYNNNAGVLVAVGMLSLALTTVRALTGRLLPCFIIHLVFNGIQVAQLIYEYFHPDKPDTKAGLIALARQLSALGHFFS
jgi:membrane protease YdiL (CAAX protease family)